MTEPERDAILTIAVLAAFADGDNDNREREEIRRAADALGSTNGFNMPALYQGVLLKRVRMEDAAATLTSADSRALAYEFAVGVCNADGAQSAAENAFLESLRAALGLATSQASAVSQQSVALAAAPLIAGRSEAPGGEASFASTMTTAEQDKMILNYSILNGALELLPQSLASMAIIPLQMKMVYRIGKSHGFELDKGHVKDFLGTLGVGLTSQYLEQFGRRLVGGLLGSIAGGLGRMAGSAATGSAFSFATTYALGHVAKRYYADGRQLSTDSLKQTFTAMLGEARQLETRYLPEIRQKAQTIDVAQVMREVTG